MFISMTFNVANYDIRSSPSKLGSFRRRFKSSNTAILTHMPLYAHHGHDVPKDDDDDDVRLSL
jgi:hypothetical protein